jgi:hypothetical protein
VLIQTVLQVFAGRPVMMTKERLAWLELLRVARPRSTPAGAFSIF